MVMTENQEELLISTVKSIEEVAKTMRTFRLAYLYNQAQSEEDRSSIMRAITNEATQDKLTQK